MAYPINPTQRPQKSASAVNRTIGSKNGNGLTGMPTIPANAKLTDDEGRVEGV